MQDQSNGLDFFKHKIKKKPRFKLRDIFKPIKYVFDFVQCYFKTMVLFLVILIFLSSVDLGEKLQDSRQANVYRIDLNYPIINSESFLEQLEEAQKDNIQGLFLVVDSPGGAVAPSVEMMMAIKEYSKTKPVLVYAKNLLVSGSYYASIWAQKIIANKAAIIGSIGVIYQGVNVEELLEKLGIKFQILKVGEYKEAGAFYRQWTETEKHTMNTYIKDIYDMFIEDVAKARRLAKSDAKKYAEGNFFIASRAKALGLIDDVGNFNSAKLAFYNLVKLDKKDVVWNREHKTKNNLLEELQEAMESKLKAFLVQIWKQTLF